MDWWMESRIRQQEYRAEAAQRRLLAEVEQGWRRMPSFSDRMLVAVGRRLSGWGERLQARELQRPTQREMMA